MLFCVLTMLFSILIYLPVVEAQTPSGNIRSIQVANNTTAIVVKPGGGLVVALEGFTNSTSTTWVKVYDAPSVTCGTGTPKARYFIPGNTNGGGFVTGPVLDLYTTGITVCITTGYADSDTTAPAASTFVVNVHWQ